MPLVQRVAQIFGWGFVLIAAYGFVVSGSSMESDPELAPKMLGLFPVNVLHNLVHLSLGVWGIFGARSWGGARAYCLGAGLVYLGLIGLAYVDPTLFGLVPIGDGDILLHVVLAAPLLIAGLAAKSDAPGRR
ncbi:MAG: DUF4383 domain-containing protein [Gemmatimonadota bacterium]